MPGYFGQTARHEELSKEGTNVEAGSQIGTHIGDQTMSDVAVAVDSPDGFRLVSWFEAITDAPFETS